MGVNSRFLSKKVVIGQESGVRKALALVRI
jgi:hypothetical protein